MPPLFRLSAGKAVTGQAPDIKHQKTALASCPRHDDPILIGGVVHAEETLSICWRHAICCAGRGGHYCRCSYLNSFTISRRAGRIRPLAGPSGWRWRCQRHEGPGMIHPRCETPAASCPRTRRWSARLSRWLWVCECDRAFSEKTDGSISELPLRGEADSQVSCPKCQSPMVLVSGSRNGDFYSCSRYPSCRGTRPVTHLEKGRLA